MSANNTFPYGNFLIDSITARFRRASIIHLLLACLFKDYLPGVYTRRFFPLESQLLLGRTCRLQVL